MIEWNLKMPKVPVDDDGNWLSYAGYSTKMQLIEPFKAVLVVESIHAGRSAKHIIVKNFDTGVRYPMFLPDFIDVTRRGVIYGGIMSGIWTASKRGQNYGIKLAKDQG